MNLRPLLLCTLLFSAALSAAPEDGGLDSIRQAISDTQNDLQKKQQARQQTQQTLDKTRAALAKAQQELAALTRRQRDTWQKLQTLQNELDGLKSEIASGKAQLARLLGGQYKNRRSNAVILFLKNAEPGRKARYLEYARQIGLANQKVVADLARQQQELQQREAEIDAELAKLDKLKAEKQAALGKLGKTRSAAERENSRLAAEIDKQSQNLARLKTDEARLNHLIAEIARRNAAKRKQEAAARAKAARERLAAEKQAAKVRKQAKPAPADGKPDNKPAPPAASEEKNKPAAPVSTLTAEDRALQGEYVGSSGFSRLQGSLPRPVGGSIAGHFGRPRPEGGVWRGLFFATAPAPVRSVADGTVAFAGSLGSYGNTVVIDHGDGYTSIYTGLSSLAASAGSSVKSGSGIGTSGSTASGEEGLYFEIRYRQSPMNPISWLR